MADPSPDKDKDKPGQELSESTFSADAGELTQHNSANKKKAPKTEKQDLGGLLKRSIQWILEPLGKYWKSLEKPEVSNRTIAIATIVIAFATVLTYLEVHSGSAQTDRIIQADERIAGAMEGAVGQANRAFDSTVEQFHLEQRAWVGPVAIIQPVFKDTDSFSISILISNSGKTPALKFGSRYSWNIILKTGVFQATFDRPQGIPSSGTILPNGELTLVSSPYPLRKQSLDYVTSGKALLYVYGELAYDDVFNKTHHTHFCTFYDQTLKPGVCNTYNDVD
jgi:hypothetical protein